MGIGAAIGTGITAIASGIGAGAAAIGLPAAATIGTIGADALVGAGAGAGLSALTGGKPGVGALTGALTGGAGAAGGLLGAGTAFGAGGGGALAGAAAGAAGSALTGGNALTGALTGGLGGYMAGSGIGTVGQDQVLPGSTDVTGTPDATDTAYGSGLAPTTYDGSSAVTAAGGTGSGGSNLNPVSQAASGSGNGLFSKTIGNGGITNTELALGALSALGSLAGKPAVSTQATPSPASTAANQGPFFNSPLNTSAPGRTPTNPWSPLPTNYSAYGGPEQTYFNNNALSAYGFAHGGALTQGRRSRPEFSTTHGDHYVQGPGDGQADQVPARLADGEYVMDATTVSRLGNGSNRKGALMLDRMRQTIAHDAGSDRVVQKKIHKSPLQYVDAAQHRRTRGGQ